MSETPRTDAVALDEREGITHPELCETYMAWTDYWAVRELARQLERELAAANANISDLYEVVRAIVYVAQHGPHDPSPIDENSPLMDAARDALAKVSA